MKPSRKKRAAPTASFEVGLRGIREPAHRHHVTDPTKASSPQAPCRARPEHEDSCLSSPPRPPHSRSERPHERTWRHQRLAGARGVRERPLSTLACTSTASGGAGQIPGHGLHSPWHHLSQPRFLQQGAAARAVNSDRPRCQDTWTRLSTCHSRQVKHLFTAASGPPLGACFQVRSYGNGTGE